MKLYGGFELTATNYNHPDIPTGQHVNGPAQVWIRYQDSPWYNTGETQMHKVKAAIDLVGVGLLEKYRSETDGRSREWTVEEI